MAEARANLERLREAQRRVLDLRQRGLDGNSRLVRAAANRLFTLLRRSPPQDLRAFDAWAAEERARREEASADPKAGGTVGGE